MFARTLLYIYVVLFALAMIMDKPVQLAVGN
jgi:hypothetical protein